MKTLLQNDLLSLSYCVVRVTIRTSSVRGWSGWWITGLAKKFVQIFLCDVMENLNKPFGQPNALEPLGHKEPEKVHCLGSNDGDDVAKRGRVSWLATPTTHFLRESRNTLMHSVWLSFPSYRWGIWSLSWSDNSYYRWAHAAGMSGGGILTLYTLNQFIINTIPAFIPRTTLDQGPLMTKSVKSHNWSEEWREFDVSFVWPINDIPCDPGPLLLVFIWLCLYLETNEFSSKLW